MILTYEHIIRNINISTLSDNPLTGRVKILYDYLYELHCDITFENYVDKFQHYWVAAVDKGSNKIIYLIDENKDLFFDYIFEKRIVDFLYKNDIIIYSDDILKICKYFFIYKYPNMSSYERYVHSFDNYYFIKSADLRKL